LGNLPNPYERDNDAQTGALPYLPTDLMVEAIAHKAGKDKRDVPLETDENESDDHDRPSLETHGGVSGALKVLSASNLSRQAFDGL
jgi:hypothetical protein